MIRGEIITLLKKEWMNISIENPLTNDEGITKYIIIGSIAIIGLIIVSIFLFKKKKVTKK